MISLYRRKEKKGIWIGWKIIGAVLFTITIVSVPLNLHFYGERTIIQNEYDQLISLAETQNVIQLQSSVTNLTNQNQVLLNEANDLKIQLAWYQGQVEQLEKQFVLVTGKAEAGVYAKSITFRRSSNSHTAYVSNEGEFSIYLKNNAVYEVHIDYVDNWLIFFQRDFSCDSPDFLLETDDTVYNAGTFTCKD